MIILPRAINNLKVHVYGGDHEFKLIWVGIGVVKVVLKGILPAGEILPLILAIVQVEVLL